MAPPLLRPRDLVWVDLAGFRGSEEGYDPANPVLRCCVVISLCKTDGIFIVVPITRTWSPHAEPVTLKTPSFALCRHIRSLHLDNCSKKTVFTSDLNPRCFATCNKRLDAQEFQLVLRRVRANIADDLDNRSWTP